MEYHRWRTRLDEAKDIFPETKKLPLATRLNIEANRLVECRNDGDLPEHSVLSEMERLAEEYLWLRVDGPYYNVHPRSVPYLSRCRLDKIPASFLEVPGGFDTVNIRFAEAHPDLTVDEGEYVRSILLAKPVCSRLGRQEFMALLEHGLRPKKLDEATESLVLHIDLGERGYCDEVPYIRDWVITIHLDPETTLEEDFARFEDAAPEQIAPGTRRREVVKNCLRLTATVGFMANTPEENFLEYDVLARDRQAFAEADDDRRKHLIARAHKRGKHGWNVGTKEMFLGEMPEWSAHPSHGQGREHTHAHIRSGHFHAVRCGEGKKNVKVKWFRPTVVRPDLAFV